MSTDRSAYDALMAVDNRDLNHAVDVLDTTFNAMEDKPLTAQEITDFNTVSVKGDLWDRYNQRATAACDGRPADDVPEISLAQLRNVVAEVKREITLASYEKPSVTENTLEAALHTIRVDAMTAWVQTADDILRADLEQTGT